jgi:hypothetical protein
MQAILQSLLDRGLAGFYFGTVDRARQVKAARGMAFGCYADYFDSEASARFLSSRSLFLEALLTAPHGQVRSFEKQGDSVVPVFKRAGTAQLHFDELQLVYSGAKQYVTDLITSYGSDLFNLEDDLESCELMFKLAAERKIGFPKSLEPALFVEDEWCGNDELDINGLLTRASKLSEGV